MRVVTFAAVLVLSGCAAAPSKPSVPEDMIPVCKDGKLGAWSESAKEGILWPVPCPERGGRSA